MESDKSLYELNRAVSHQARLLRERYLKDPHRPGYHFVVPEGQHAPVDPNGAIFWNGRFHLCYIYQNEGRHYWGHVSSHDLVHWRHHPPALSPGGADDGIFSGGAFLDRDGTPTFSYWGLGKPDGICFASSNEPNLDVWTKHPKNPVVASTQWGLVEKDGQVYGSADPSAIWLHEGRYYMLTGNICVLREFGERRGMPEHLGDTAYLLVSDDLVKWDYMGPFYKSRREWTAADEDDMCPDFFPLPSSSEGGKDSGVHMLLFISHNKGCQYYLGKYHGTSFEPSTHGRMSWVDKAFFAPESLADSKGRRIMWAWLMDGREDASRDRSGWSGELSLPRVLWLGDDGTLRMKPADELASLRINPKRLENLKVENRLLRIDSLSGDSLELCVEMKAGGSVRRAGLDVRVSPGREEHCSIYVDFTEGTLNVDTRKASLGEGPKSIETAPFKLKQGEPLKLRVFIDKSVVEVFANERQAIARHVYPSRLDSLGVALFSEGGALDVALLDAWEMMPSNPC